MLQRAASGGKSATDTNLEKSTRRMCAHTHTRSLALSLSLSLSLSGFCTVQGIHQIRSITSTTITNFENSIGRTDSLSHSLSLSHTHTHTGFGTLREDPSNTFYFTLTLLCSVVEHMYFCLSLTHSLSLTHTEFYTLREDPSDTFLFTSTLL